MTGDRYAGFAHGINPSRAFFDIAEALDAADDADGRVIRVLELLASLVPGDQRAVLEALPGRPIRLLTGPDTSTAERDDLEPRIRALLLGLREHHGPRPVEAPNGSHLAVPLVSLDEVVGVLYVSGGAYDEGHVRTLSVVASMLAAYSSMLRLLAREAERTRELDEALLRAESANRAKDEFLALVSHELRTPLGTILAWADALRSLDTPEADRAQAFEAIERTVRAQATRIGDLLDLSNASATTLRLDLRAVEPAAVIRDTIRALRPGAEQKSIQLRATLDHSMTLLVADPQRLGQIVARLVANAIKFTPKGGRIDVHLERAGAQARIRVIDTGAGIRPELLPGLFEPFRPLDPARARVHGGLGVGLALVKDLVALHGGEVRAESAGVAAGATFTVDLPLGGGLLDPRSEPEDIGDALEGVRVLLVDDDPDICEVLQFVLECQGAVVTVASSATEALEALESAMPDVLVSDIEMPGQSGYDLMRTIIARKGDASPPAAALSSYTPGQALASGFRVEIAKPVDPEALVAAVAALAGRPSAAAARLDA